MQRLYINKNFEIHILIQQRHVLLDLLQQSLHKLNSEGFITHLVKQNHHFIAFLLRN